MLPDVANRRFCEPLGDISRHLGAPNERSVNDCGTRSPLSKSRDACCTSAGTFALSGCQPVRANATAGCSSALAAATGCVAMVCSSGASRPGLVGAVLHDFESLVVATPNHRDRKFSRAWLGACTDERMDPGEGPGRGKATGPCRIVVRREHSRPSGWFRRPAAPIHPESLLCRSLAGMPARRDPFGVQLVATGSSRTDRDERVDGLRASVGVSFASNRSGTWRGARRRDGHRQPRWSRTTRLAMDHATTPCSRRSAGSRWRRTAVPMRTPGTLRPVGGIQ